MENLSNREKVEVSALIGDVRQSVNSLGYQISAIEKALDPEILYDMTEWINMIHSGLEKMQKTVDEVIDWAALEGTDW